MKLSSAFLAASVLCSAPRALAWSLTWQRYSGTVLENAFYGGSYGFPVWAQGAEKTLIPLFQEIKGEEVTLMMPSTESFNDILEARGGNWSDPRSGMTPAFQDFWADVMPYFFFKGRLNVSDVVDGTTVLLESYKQSPVGDWPLLMAYRRDPGVEDAYLAEFNSTWNGTVFNEPYAAGNVSIAAFDINAEVVGLVFDLWPTEPKNLTETVAALGIEGWPSLTEKLSAAAALDTQRNFTLFLPPAAVIAAAVSDPSDDLSAFFDAHLVFQQIALSLAAQEFTTQAGAALSAAAGWVSVGGVNATITNRDVLTNGGIVQVIDRSLLA